MMGRLNSFIKTNMEGSRQIIKQRKTIKKKNDYKAVILQINTKLEKPESDAQGYSGTHIIQVENNNI